MTNKEMINKFKDYADIADASYAMLHYVFENIDSIFESKQWEEADGITNRDKTIKNDKYLNGGNISPNFNTAYARAIESRFQKDIVVEEGLIFDDKLGDSPKMVSVTRELSQRTTNFVRRFKLLHHQPNTDSGFSGTLFEDKGELIDKETNTRKVVPKDSKYILAFRGTEISNLEDLWTDVYLVLKKLPREQYFDMIEFYRQCIIRGHITESTPLVVVGHSLGGALAQLFTLSIADSKNANNIKEVYTFNSPGVKNLQLPYNINPFPHFVIKVNKNDTLNEYAVNNKIEQILNDYYKVFKYEKQDEDTKQFNTTLVNQLQENIQHLKYTIENEAYLEIYYDSFNAMLPYVFKANNISGAKYYFTQKYFHYLYTNYQEQSTIATNNNTYHIESTMDATPSIPIIGYPNNATQNLWTDIDGFHYQINISLIGVASHFLDPMLKILYLYSYLVELDSNNAMLESKIQSNNDKKRLSEYLYILNVFMKNIKTAMNILINEIDKKNKEKYKKFRKQTKWYQSTQNYEDIDYLALFISQVNGLAFKIESLKNDNNQYFTSNIDINEIIDTIYKLQEYNYFIEIIDNNKLKVMRDKCKANKKASIAEKLSLETCQPFRLVNKNNISYLNENNFHQIFGYKDLGYILSQEWHEEYINGRYKMMKGLYFRGNTISSLSKYAKDKELQIS